jgi:hypothetical protein
MADLAPDPPPAAPDPVPTVPNSADGAVRFSAGTYFSCGGTSRAYKA